MTTFKERTKQFWDWFTANEEKLSALVQRDRSVEGDGEADVSFVSEGVSLLSEDLHFNIGGDCEFTFAVNGKYEMFFLLPYVTANLPAKFLGKWSFFPYMQGTGGRQFGLRMFDVAVGNDKVMVSAVPDGDGRTAGLRFYAKEWAGLEDNKCYSAFYTLMELSIGEALANVCVSEVNRADSIEKGMFPLTELEQWMIERLCEDGKVPDPAERYFTYKIQPEDDGMPREDIFLGFTSCIPLLNGYDSGERSSYSVFEEFGAKPVFLYYQYDDSGAERGVLLDERNAIMDRLEAEVLGERGSGKEIGLILGGSVGERCFYIDLLLYDEPAFMNQARPLLSKTPHRIFCKAFEKDAREVLLTGR